MQGDDSRAKMLVAQKAAAARLPQPRQGVPLKVSPPLPGRSLPVAQTLEQLESLQMEKAAQASLATLKSDEARRARKENVVNLTHLADSISDPVNREGGGGGGGGGGAAANATFSQLDGSRVDYIESQKSQYCGKHALNNLLGGEYFITSSGKAAYSREDAIRIGKDLSRINKFDLNRFCKLLAQTPGLIEDPGQEPCPDNGNFGSNVLVLALKISGFQTSYINIEKGYSDFKTDKTDNLVGYIVNYGGGHWVCLIYNKRSNNYIYKDSIGPISKNYTTITEYIGGRTNILQILRVSKRSQQDTTFLKGMRNAKNEAAANKGKSNQIKLLGLLDANKVLDKSHKDKLKTVVIPFSRLEHQQLIERSIQDPVLNALINSFNVDDMVNTEVFLFLISVRAYTGEYIREMMNSIKQIIILHKSISIDNIINAYAFNFFDAAKTNRYLNDHPELNGPDWVDPNSNYYRSEDGKRLIAYGKKAMALLRGELGDIEQFKRGLLSPAVTVNKSAAAGGIAPKVPPSKFVKKCPVCRFNNDMAATVCAQCGTSLVDVVPGPAQGGGKRSKTNRRITKRHSKKGTTQKCLKRH